MSGRFGNLKEKPQRGEIFREKSISHFPKSSDARFYNPLLEEIHIWSLNITPSISKHPMTRLSELRAGKDDAEVQGIAPLQVTLAASGRLGVLLPSAPPVINFKSHY